MFLKCFLTIGGIHNGHVRNYKMGDVIARFKRLGFNVSTPGLGVLRHDRERGIERGVHRRLDLREYCSHARSVKSGRLWIGAAKSHL